MMASGRSSRVRSPLSGEMTPSLPELVRSLPYCDLAARWLINPELAWKIHEVAIQVENETGREVYILSGYRTAEEQELLRRQGRPAAPDDRSTHRTCPATGADLWMGPLPTATMKATFGRIVSDLGLRWGGGSPPDPETGIPEDWNHVDLGPRTT